MSRKTVTVKRRKLRAALRKAWMMGYRKGLADALILNQPRR